MVIRKQKGKGQGKTQRRRFRVQWREPKLLIVFVMDEKGRMKRGSRPWIDGTFQGPDECMELVQGPRIKSHPNYGEKVDPVKGRA